MRQVSLRFPELSHPARTLSAVRTAPPTSLMLLLALAG
jgi:hypothetical protein